MNATKVFEKRQEEMTALSTAISAYDKRAAQLKPSVTEYNELMQSRKKLRKELAAKQREAKIVAEWFKGTTIIDERFPLFANQHEPEPTK